MSVSVQVGRSCDVINVNCVIGTTAQSCSIRLVLGNVCWHLASLAGADVTSIPGDYAGLVSYFHRILKVCSELLSIAH